MSLTIGHGPLANDPSPANYDISGPTLRLFFDDFPRRIRATLAGETVVDSRRAKLLHETGRLPQLYVPAEDHDEALLQPTDRLTHCPVRGEASYWSVVAGSATAHNAMWAYQQPPQHSAWLRGYRALSWGAMDSWWDEDEQVYGHLRDPYHRVDVRHTNQRVRVLAGSEVIAESAGAEVLSETGMPNRYYLPPDSVRAGALQPSDTVTICAYKGTAAYWSLNLPGITIPDVAWSYPDPLVGAALQVREHLCFATDQHDELKLEIGT